MRGTANDHLSSTTVIIVAFKIPLWMLKLKNENLRKYMYFLNKYLPTLKISLKVFIKIKGRHSTFTVEKRGGYHLRKLTELRSSVLGHINVMHTQTGCTSELLPKPVTSI